MTSAAGLSEKSRKELLKQAEGLGVDRPNRMTMVELRDEIIRRTTAPGEREEARGLFGVARSMLASVIESGLNLPDTARLIRGEGSVDVPLSSQTPVATVTLAEIYAAQGHRARALKVLEDVLMEEPDHQEALRVRAELLDPGSEESLASREESRSALTRATPPVEDLPGATPEYIPGGYLETTGEEIETGRPPEVAPVEQESKPVAAPTAEPLVAEVTSGQAEQADEGFSAEDAPTEVEQVVEPIVAAADEAPRTPQLLLVQTSSGLEVHWEIPDAAAPGSVIIQVVGFVPHGATPVRREKTVTVEQATGQVWLEEFSSPCAVRAALGRQDGSEFVAFTLGRFVEEIGSEKLSRELLARALRP